MIDLGAKSRGKLSTLPSSGPGHRRGKPHAEPGPLTPATNWGWRYLVVTEAPTSPATRHVREPLRQSSPIPDRAAWLRSTYHRGTGAEEGVLTPGPLPSDPSTPGQPAPFSHTLVTFIYSYILSLYIKKRKPARRETPEGPKWLRKFTVPPPPKILL